MYLLLAIDINTILLKLATAKRYWHDETKILQIVNNILDHGNGLPFPAMHSNSLLPLISNISIFVSCLFCTAMGVCHWFTGRLYFITYAKPNVITIQNYWNMSVWWDQMMSQGHFTFFLDQDSYTPLRSMAVVLASMGYLWRLILGANEELFFLIAALTLWITASEFQQRLQTSFGKMSRHPKNRQFWPHILREYKAIKSVANIINNVVSWTMINLVVHTVLFNSVNFDDFFLNNLSFDWLKTSTFGFYSLTICGIFLLMADVTRKVCKAKFNHSNYIKVPTFCKIKFYFEKTNSLRKWFSSGDAKCQVLIYELTLILSELDNHEVAIKAANIFPITYGLITHVMLHSYQANFIP